MTRSLTEITPINEYSLESKIRHHLLADLLHIVSEQKTAERLRRRSKDLFRHVRFIQRAARLMTIAKEEIIHAAIKGRAFPDGQIYWAETLSMAKGRMERKWQAEPGGIYLCMAIFPRLLPENLQLYNLASGLSICQILREWGVDAHIRWLNDILIRGKKVAGILAETVVTPDLGEKYLLIGIGINVNQATFPPHLTSHSTSLFKETGRNWPIIELGTHVLSRMVLNFSLLHDWEAKCLQAEHWPEVRLKNPVIKAYRGLCDFKGRRIRYGRDLERFPGQRCIAMGILEDGSLRLKLEDGAEATVNSGEIRYEEAS